MHAGNRKHVAEPLAPGDIARTVAFKHKFVRSAYGVAIFKGAYAFCVTDFTCNDETAVGCRLNGSEAGTGRLEVARIRITPVP
jgi:hypothetical protein